MPVRYDLSVGNVVLLAIDMQNDFLQEGSPLELPAGRSLVENINLLIDRSRALAIPVLFLHQEHDRSGADLNHVGPGTRLADDLGRPTALQTGSYGAEVYADVSQSGSDIHIHKHRQSGFFETNLESILRGLSAKTLLVTGIASNGCVLATAMDAMYRDYQVVFLSDATACRSMPDAGWGAFSAETLQAVTLTLATFAVGEVATTADVLARLDQLNRPAHNLADDVGAAVAQ